MKEDNSSDSRADGDNTRQCTPKQHVSYVNVEDLTSAFPK